MDTMKTLLKIFLCLTFIIWVVPWVIWVIVSDLVDDR